MIDLNKKIEMCLLADFYGNLLTEKQHKVLSAYYEKDISLSELAEELSISRQAVYDTLAKSENILLDLEKKCGFMCKYRQNKQELEQILKSIDTAVSGNKAIANRISKLIDKL